jgi:hypothetical protein
MPWKERGRKRIRDEKWDLINLNINAKGRRIISFEFSL